MDAGLVRRKGRRIFRLDRDDADVRLAAAQGLGNAAHAGGGSRALHERIDPAARLGPDLLRHRVIGGELIGVVELVGPEGARSLGDLARGFDHVAGQRRVHAAAGAGDDGQLGAERRHVIALLGAERVGRDDAERIAARGANERKRNAGAAAGVFDDALPGFSRPVRSPASIMASAMRSFMLPVGLALSTLIRMRAQPSGTMRLELEQRRVADAVQDGRVDVLFAAHCAGRPARFVALVCIYIICNYIYLWRDASAPPARRWSADAREVVHVCAGMNIRLAARRITRFLEARMQGTDLSIAQFGLMTQIAAAGDDTIGALAERSGLEQSTLSRNLRSLERAGLIEIAIVEKDLRRRAVWLTERGARRLEAAIPVWRRAHAALSGAVNPSDVVKMAAMTAVLAAKDTAPAD